jgi:hypothetical protein
MAGSRTIPCRKYGHTTGDALKACLADVIAAKNAAELPLLVPDETISNRFRLYAGPGCCLLFESNHADDREVPVGKKVKWEKVTRVQLLEVICNG